MTYRNAAPLLSQYQLVAFPLGGDDGKKPLVANWAKLRRSVPGLSKFSTANTAIAMRQSKLTVVDVDDRSALPECLDRFGETPVKVETSRGFHLYYRANGERGMKLRPNLVADLKTGNAYVVAPDSIHVKTGKIYTWIEGGPELLEPSNDRLPTIKPGALEGLSRFRQGSKQDAASEPPRDSQGRVLDGRRTDLFAHLRTYAHVCGGSRDGLLAEGRNWGMNYADPPLTDDEVVKQANGVMKLWEEGRCLVPGSKAHLICDSDLFAAFAGNANAWFLFSKIKMTWGDRLKPFPISDWAMARAGVIPGWGRQRYRAATTALEEIGVITLERQGTGTNKPSLYVWVDRVRKTYTK